MIVVPNLVFDVIVGRSFMAAFDLVLYMEEEISTFHEINAKRQKFQYSPVNSDVNVLFEDNENVPELIFE